jgi:hypothetical protein
VGALPRGHDPFGCTQDKFLVPYAEKVEEDRQECPSCTSENTVHFGLTRDKFRPGLLKRAEGVQSTAISGGGEGLWR